MPLPARYTETTLAAYMLQSLGPLADTLGLDTPALYDAVLDVAGACGVADIQGAADMAQVRALAKVAALRVAQLAAASWYDFGADGGDYKRSQVQKQITEALKLAERDAMLYDQVYAVGLGVMHLADPYVWGADDQEAAGAG